MDVGTATGLENFATVPPRLSLSNDALCLKVVRSRTAPARKKKKRLSRLGSSQVLTGTKSLGTSKRAKGTALSVRVVAMNMAEQTAIWDALSMYLPTEDRPSDLSCTVSAAGSAGLTADCLLCPLVSPFGLGDSPWEQALCRSLGDGADLDLRLRDEIEDKFAGEMPARATLMVALSEKNIYKAKRVLFVCLDSASLDSFPGNYVYAGLRSALVALHHHNIHFLHEKNSGEILRSLLVPFLPAAGPLAELSHCEWEIARQMATALTCTPVPIFGSWKEYEAYDVLPFTQEEKRKRQAAQALSSAESLELAATSGLANFLRHAPTKDIVSRGLGGPEELQRMLDMADKAATPDEEGIAGKAFRALCHMVRCPWVCASGQVTRRDVVDGMLKSPAVFSLLLSACPSLYLEEVSAADLQIDEKLGRGGTSVVRAAVWKGQKVALKIFRDGAVSEVALWKELAASALLDHPYIVRFLAFGYTPDMHGDDLPYVVMSLHSKGSLYDLLHGEGKTKLELGTALRLATELATALAYLHGHHLIHRDVKSANVLLDDANHVKLTDFGSSRLAEANSQMTNMVGTLSWMAPEVLTSHTYSTKADVYSFGMVLYELLCGRLPFAGLPSIHIPARIGKGVRPEIPKGQPKALVKLIKSCWAQNPSKRPTMERVLGSLEEESAKLAPGREAKT